MYVCMILNFEKELEHDSCQPTTPGNGRDSADMPSNSSRYMLLSCAPS